MKTDDSILLTYINLLDPDHCSLWNGFSTRNITSPGVGGHFFSHGKKITCDATYCVAGFPSKVLEVGPHVPQIVPLERGPMAHGLGNARGASLDISCTLDEGMSTNYCFPQCLGLLSVSATILREG